MKKLPVLISIPHGGRKIPTEIRDIIIAEKRDLNKDSDIFTDEIFNLKDEVLFFIKSEIIRAAVDLSRPENDLPPLNKDGVIKSNTCHGKEIYRNFPDKKLIKSLIEKYYNPYHASLIKGLKTKGLKLGLDCHSMCEFGPEISPDKGEKRPLICLGNLNGKTCSGDVLLKLKKGFMEVFKFSDNEISFNKPFSGGYITRKYGTGELPFVQIEINRSLYINEKKFDFENRYTDTERIESLRNGFLKVLIYYFS